MRRRRWRWWCIQFWLLQGSRRDDTRFGGHDTRGPEVPPAAKLAGKNTWVGRPDPLKLSTVPKYLTSLTLTQTLTLHWPIQRPSTSVQGCLHYILKTRALLNHVNLFGVVVDLSMSQYETISFVVLSALSPHDLRPYAACRDLVVKHQM